MDCHFMIILLSKLYIIYIYIYICIYAYDLELTHFIFLFPFLPPLPSPIFLPSSPNTPHPRTPLEDAIFQEFHSCNEVNSVNNPNMSLEADSSPVEPPMRPRPWPTPGLHTNETLKQRTQMSFAQIFNLQRLGDNKHVLFEAAKSVGICCAATENKYTHICLFLLPISITRFSTANQVYLI